MRVLVLGAGSVGSNAAKQLAKSRPDVHIRIGDLRLANAQKAATAAGPNAEGVEVDVHDAPSLTAAFDEVDIVLNTAGPFYRNATPILNAAVAAKAHYVDVNDDDDVAVKILADSDLNSRAKAAGVRVIIGCGTTPGVSNLIARHSMDQLDMAQRVVVTMLLSFQGIRYYSPAVLDHMFHISSGEVTRYEGGKIIGVDGFGDEREIRAIAPFGTYKSYNAGHGETAMLGHSHPHLEEAAVRLAWVEDGANERWRTLMEIGLSSSENVEAAGISPVKFLGSMLGTGQQLPYFDDTVPVMNGTIVEVTGVRDGRAVTIKTLMNFSASEDNDVSEFDPEGDNDPTSTAARLGVEAILDERVTGEGVLTPEVCFQAADFITRFTESSPVILTQETTSTGAFATS